MTGPAARIPVMSARKVRRVWFGAAVSFGMRGRSPVLPHGRVERASRTPGTACRSRPVGVICSRDLPQSRPAGVRLICAAYRLRYSTRSSIWSAGHDGLSTTLTTEGSDHAQAASCPRHRDTDPQRRLRLPLHRRWVVVRLRALIAVGYNLSLGSWASGPLRPGWTRSQGYRPRGG